MIRAHLLKSSLGFSILEIVVAVGIVATALVFILGTLALGVRVLRVQAETREAVFVAEEGAEATRFLRDADWTSYIAALTPGAVYYAVRSGQTWVMQTANPGPIQNRYTRTIVLARVYRDANGAIASSGTEDQNARSFIVTVTWSGTFGSHTVSVPGYVMNILGDT